MPRKHIDMALPGYRRMHITVENEPDRSILVTLLNTSIGTASMRLPPSIAFRLAEALKDAALSTQDVPTPAQQAEQGAACGCGGGDDMCPCQNVVPVR